ncbi:MAG: SH3 domain-containing protein [Clostridia bacterium]|nr:SH3 domain-containing protein [Clostridia bacterium]
MKKLSWAAALLALILTLCLAAGALAGIIPPYGEGQIGYQAEILCEELTLRDKPSTSGKALKTLYYGDVLLVMKEQDGWAYCTISDAEDALTGWVNADYIIVDPAYYRTDKSTPVYAWDDTSAPKIALLDKGTRLTIVKDEGSWLIVSLRGAVGWIQK